jgi:predicted TPR repeat methyltransferase
LPKIEEVQAAHQAGRLEEAKQGYLALLNEHPDDVVPHHLLSLIYAEEGDWPAAQRSLEKALALKPGDPVLSLHLANIFKAQHDFAQAEQLLQAVMRAHPHFAAAHNNLGTLYFAQQKWAEAVAAYQAAIDIQANYADAYYNLGLALNKLKRFEEAKHTYQALIELAPEHPGAHFQLGCLLMQQNQFSAALEQFLVIEQKHPHHFETQTNIAACYLKLGHLNQAKIHYLRAVSILPSDSQIYFNLGVIHMQQGRVREAIDFYARAVTENSDFYEAQNNLGVAYMVMKNREAALKHFREALRLQPGNEVLQHTIHILLRAQNLSISPPEYVRSLFDSYAGHYDFHLTQSLHYQVPKLMLAAVKKFCQPALGQWDILDLGCGTGLCGELFKPMAHRLIGIDLSEKMLEAAAKKNIYQQLIKSDILPFLTPQQSAYDLVMAGDVFVYCGDLAAIFTAIRKALRPEGLFLFNAEIGTDKDYEMTESGRFAHSQSYLERLIAQNEFSIVHYQAVPLRTQNETPVKGHLYLLRCMVDF